MNHENKSSLNSMKMICKDKSKKKLDLAKTRPQKFLHFWVFYLQGKNLERSMRYEGPLQKIQRFE